MTSTKEPIRPPQHQERQPGTHAPMRPKPQAEAVRYRGGGRLTGRAALITGGDSGIGRSVAIAFAKEGADVALAYLDEHDDARETQRLVEATGRHALLLSGDLGDESACQLAVARTVESFGRLDVVVNNAAWQQPQERFEDIATDQLERTFRTNVYAAFHLVRAALRVLPPGSAIINTVSIVAYRGSAHLVDYAATKGALVAFTRSLALNLVDRGIRVNMVAPGPVWTPLIASTFPPDHVASFGSDVPMHRAGEPDEMAAAYVYLACDDSSYMTGQCLHLNGGVIING